LLFISYTINHLWEACRWRQKISHFLAPLPQGALAALAPNQHRIWEHSTIRGFWTLNAHGTARKHSRSISKGLGTKGIRPVSWAALNAAAPGLAEPSIRLRWRFAYRFEYNDLKIRMKITKTARKTTISEMFIGLLFMCLPTELIMILTARNIHAISFRIS
jgi:hypothetical protein